MKPARDDRGAVIVPLSPEQVKRLAEADPVRAKALTRLLLDATRRHREQKMRWRGALTGFLGVAVVIVVSSSVARARLPFISGPLGTLSVFVLGIAGVSYVQFLMARREIASGIAATIVAEGWCGACGYTLESLAPGPEGRVTCPECGAEWRASRITSAPWGGVRGGVPNKPVKRWEGEKSLFIRSPGRRLTQDGRGRFVPAVDSRLWVLSKARRAEIGEDVCRVLARRVGRVGRVYRWVSIGVLVAIAAGCGAGMIVLSQERDTNGTLVLPGVLGVMCVIGALGVWGTRMGCTPAGAAAALTRSGHCGVCAGRLAGRAPADDGLTACPECGAAWRIAGVVCPRCLTAAKDAEAGACASCGLEYGGRGSGAA